MATLKIWTLDTENNGYWAEVGSDSMLKYVGQNLTENQKVQARANIDAISQTELNTQLATKTSVTISGFPQETFNADTKISVKDGWSMSSSTPWRTAAHVQQNNRSQTKDYITEISSTNTFEHIANTFNLAGLQKFFGGNGTYGTIIPTYFSKSLLDTDSGIVKQIINNNPTLWSSTAVAEGAGELLTGWPTTSGSAVNKSYVDDICLPKTGGTISGNLTVNGNLQIKGISETVDAVTYKVENNLIEFNPDKTYNNTWLTGIAINKGTKDGTDLGTYGIMYDPSTDAVKLGFGTVSENHTFTFNENESAPIATREEFDNSWEDDAIFVFDKTTKSFKYSGKTLESYKKEIQDEMKAYMAQFIAEYVENYMSSETIVYPDGTTETNSDILYVNGTTTEISEEDGSTTLIIEEE